jgi:hypothetical protein
VRIFLHGYLYAVTQHLLTRTKFLFLNSLKGFWRSLAEISYFHFVDNSNQQKDLVICILWTLVMSSSDAQAKILTVILTLSVSITHVSITASAETMGDLEEKQY